MQESFRIEEVMTGSDDGLLWLSLGFASAHDPLDVLHIACGTALTGDTEADALYLERTASGPCCSSPRPTGTKHMHWK